MSDTLPAEQPRPAHRPALPFEQRIPRDYQDNLLSRIADGMSVSAAVRDLNRFSKAAVFNWLNESEEFRDRFERARKLQRQVWADEQIDLAADDSQDEKRGTAAVKRSELMLGTRRWLLERLEPETYSPRQRVDHQHTHKHELDPDTASLLSDLRTELQAERGQLIEGQATEVEPDEAGE